MLDLTPPRHVSTLPFPVRRAAALQASPARNRASGHGHPRSWLGEPPDLDRAMRPTGPGQAPSPTEGPPAPATPRPVIRPRLSAKPARSLASPASSVRSTDKPASEPATRITAHRQRPPFAIRSISLGVERPGLSFAEGVWRWRPRWWVGGPPALAQTGSAMGASPVRRYTILVNHCKCRLCKQLSSRC
jgi:hypothetical protein